MTEHDEMKDGIRVPTRELVSQTGYSAEMLSKILVLPQWDRESYRLLVADLSLVNVNEYLGLGIAVQIAPGTTIAAKWQQYFADNATLPELYEAYRSYTSELQTQF